MAGRRFTDSAKWRNSWFRKLSKDAKLVWDFLCCECDSAGVWKADYELASFQLDFKINREILGQLLGSKICFIGEDLVVVLGYYKFQYETAKENWSAKIQARNRLEALGFKIDSEDNLIFPQSDHNTPTVGDSGPTVLIRGKGKVEGNEGVQGENELRPDLESAFNHFWDEYPNKVNFNEARKAFAAIIWKFRASDIIEALERYKRNQAKFADRKYLNPENFLARIENFLRPDYGLDEKKTKPKKKPVEAQPAAVWDPPAPIHITPEQEERIKKTFGDSLLEKARRAVPTAAQNSKLESHLNGTPQQEAM